MPEHRPQSDDTVSPPVRAPDLLFTHPRLTRIYDDLDGARDDLDLYLDLIDELGARHVLDVGCGTGSWATRLAETRRHVRITAADPAVASLAVARRKPHAEGVTWISAPAGDLPRLDADVATMTGNVAQVFVTDGEWSAALTGIRGALAGSAHLIFETRRPERQAWKTWTEARTRRVLRTAEGPVETWTEIVSVKPPMVSFVTVCHFLADGELLRSTSTLRFRSEGELRATLADTGFSVVDIRDAPDRPGHEMVVIATTV